MESCFHLDHARKTSVAVYLNYKHKLNHKSSENHAISVKNRHVLDLHHSVRPALYEEHHYVLVDFLVTNLTRWHEEGAIIHLNSTIILWYFSSSYRSSQRFKLWRYYRSATRETKESYFKLSCKTIWENSKFLLDDLRNRSSYSSQKKKTKIAVSTEVLMANNPLTQQHLCNCGLMY